MKVCVIEMNISNKFALGVLAALTHKELLFDFLNSYFDFTHYGYEIIEGKVDVQPLGEKLCEELIITYNYEDKILLNLCGLYSVVISDITFEKKEAR